MTNVNKQFWGGFALLKSHTHNILSAPVLTACTHCGFTRSCRTWWWLTADFPHSGNSTTCHWLKETQSVLRVCWITLARFVQVRKCWDWYACNHQLADCQLHYLLGDFTALKRKFWGLLCPTERESYLFLGALVCMHFYFCETAQPFFIRVDLNGAV